MKGFGFKQLKSQSKRGGAIPFLGVSFIILILTVAIYFVADYVSQSYADDSRLSNWGYLYTEKAGVVPDGELRIYNAQNPILTESGVRKDHLYLTKMIPASDKAVNFVLITDYAPVKIRLNGREIYNNQFDTGEFVGNCYNAVRLEPLAQERQIEVFMKLPFSVRCVTYLDTSDDPAFTPSLGFVLGAVLMGAGLLVMLVFAVLSVVKRRLFRSLYVAGAIGYVGFVITLHLLPEVTYLFNDPVWLRLAEIPVHLTAMLALACLTGLFKTYRKTGIAILFASAISVIAVMASFTPLTVKLSSALMCLLTLAASLYATREAMTRLDRRIQYAAPVFVMSAYCTLTLLIAGLLLVSRQRVLYIYNIAISAVVMLCVVEYIYISDYRFEKKNSQLRAESNRYSGSVDGISQFIRSMLRCDDKERFFDTAVQEILTLLTKYDPANDDVRYCVAVKSGDAYREIANHGVGACGYQTIEDNCLQRDRNCLFAETYFEYILRDGAQIGAVFHFENIHDGLDVFFASMIEATYCGLETTYENIFVQNGQRDVNIIFAELAENAELDNGCTVDHLKNINRYTRELCQRLGIDENRASQIGNAAELHDLGKIAVPKNIIHKEGRLSEEERVIINSHTEFGYTILNAYDDDPLLATAAVIARYHHERYDGNGHNGLKGTDIPQEARIVTVCDVYDALVSERTYKKAWTKEEAIRYLSDNEGKIFDPVICETFIAYLNEN
ncbi:MAG: HD domain-containing protein [Ruminococcus sp.]|nr:HD domain-containing protein [Ruminococcus sp.]